MQDRAHFRMTVLSQPRQQHPAPKSHKDQSLFQVSINKSTQRRIEVSLVFLSTFMQIEHVKSCSSEKQIHRERISKTEPIQQLKQVSPKCQSIHTKRVSLNKFYQAKMDKIQTDQRSITAIVGTLKPQKPPAQRLLTQITQTFQRARTFSTMPIYHKQRSSLTKNQNSRTIKIPFQGQTSKRNLLKNTSYSSSQYNQKQTAVSTMIEPQVRQRLKLSNFLSKPRGGTRRLLTEYVKADRSTFNEAMGSAKSSKTKTIGPKQFGWTQMGNGAFKIGN